MHVHQQFTIAVLAAASLLPAAAFGQAAAPPAPANTASAPPTVSGVTPPAGYVIGPADVLTVVFWRDKDMSGEVAVRPDGMISLPLVNDVQASGLTPEELRVRLTEAAAKFVEEPSVTVVVKEINSRKVFITGMVNKPAAYLLGSPTTVLQLIAIAGGLQEYAKEDNIVVVRPENGKTTRLKFNYKQVLEGKNLDQNVELKPGDTVIVP